MSSLFPPDSKLDEGVRNAIVTCLAVQPGERCTLIAEAGMGAMTRAFRAALEGAAGDDVRVWVLDRADCEAPATVTDIIARLRISDVSILICTVDGVPSHLRRTIISTPGDRRHAHMPGITEAMMAQSMRADYEEVHEIGERLIARLARGGTLRVRAPMGTDLRVEIGTRYRWHNESGLLREPGWTNLPAGELITTPESVDGVLVPDGGAWDVSAKPIPASIRMKLTFEDGRITDIEGPRADVASYLAMLDEHRDGRRVGQCAFGTNVGVLTTVGTLLQDLKVPGFHITLGHTAPELTGAAWTSEIECPLLMRKADVELDGEPILRAGRYVERLRR